LFARYLFEQRHESELANVLGMSFQQQAKLFEKLLGPLSGLLARRSLVH